MPEAALLRTETDDVARSTLLHAVPGPAPAGPRLEIPTYDLAAAVRLERELGVSHVLAQVLVRRGIRDAAVARTFLDPREAYAPSAFSGIDRVLGLIEGHIERGSRIVVHGDYDVDGVCATAIMVRALRARGGDVGWYLPDRLADGYGLSPATVRRLAGSGAGLLVTVDCAITAVDEVAAAREAGLDVVVSDHHAPRADGRLPECEIVHPGVCGYPCPDLCGTGVAYKLAEALGAPTAEEDLELVALATVADLMPLVGENRRLVRAGLLALSRTARPGLRALMSAANVDPSALDSGALAFRLAPRINACGRLRRADAGLELLLTEDHRRAAQIASELERVNAERRAVEQRIAWEAEAQVAEQGERRTYVLAGEGWHPGVVGIVASRVVERHHRPTVVVGLDGDVGSGSARSIPGFDLLAALHAGAEHLERYGGHRAAAGMTIRRERLEAFREALEGHAEEVLVPELLVARERVDAIASGCELGLALAEELERLEPCGVGNPRARLLVPGARLHDLRPMGEGRHLRFSVGSAGISARGVAFGCDGRLGVEADEPVDATFRLERNFWRGAVEPRLVLGHARPCAPPGIEVLGEPGDYLAAVLGELEREAFPDSLVVPKRRAVLDRRGHSPLAVLADALSAGGPLLAVCADTTRRRAGLEARTGGFGLISYHALGCDPALAEPFAHLVALDPPFCPAAGAVLDAGRGYTHLAWGEPELRFAQQMHELEYGLRASLAALYRSLRLRGRVTGEELEHVLRGDGPHGRPARLAARLIKVLGELDLVSLDPDLPALAIAGAQPTALERSAAYRVYAKRYEDGKRFLSSANHLPRRLTRGRPKDGSGPQTRDGAQASAVFASRPPVDRVEHPDAHGQVARLELTPAERRLLSDLFAIVEEHAHESASSIDRGRVEEAFVYACVHHADQRRRSGEDFIVHPVGVAKICAGMRLDTETLCAALLHDTVEDTSASLEEVHEAFGEEIAGLVDGVTKLTGLTFQSRDEAQAENYRKMMVAMATDIRVILIKLADRLHNMRTISAMSKQKQIEKARETLDIYAPIAHRLGIHAIKWELEDLAFQTLHPRKYNEIKGLVAQQRAERERYVNQAAVYLGKELEEIGVQAEISGRAKHFYSIYAKMTKKGREFNEIYDLTAMRVIVGSVKDCYGAVGVIHSLWKPLPGRFKDFVAMPKFNMYQSLHTTVIGPEGRPLEIQIRTREMHDLAEYGIAAHWMYKETGPRDGGAAQESDGKLKWLRSLLDWQQEEADPREFMETLKVDLFEDEVFVFTPKGEVKSLAAGATPLDFAYEIHTDVGHRCVGAKVNGKIVPLSYQLRSGDIVEVLTSKRERGPSRDWLALVKTTRARNKIKAWFKAESRKDSEHAGRELLQDHLKKQGLPAQKIVGSSLLADVIREMGFRKAEDFYIALGGAKISAKVVVNKIMQRLKQGEAAESEPTAADDLLKTHRRRSRATTSSSRFGISVEGIDEVMLRLAKCCRPVPGDPIVGYISLGRGITIHREDCPNVAVLRKDPDRFTPVAWDGDPETSFRVEIEVDGWDRHRLLEDMSRTFAETGINILEARCTVNHPMVKNRFVVEVGDTRSLDQAINRLRNIDAVFDAYRVTPAA